MSLPSFHRILSAQFGVFVALWERKRRVGGMQKGVRRPPRRPLLGELPVYALGGVTAGIAGISLFA
jgi:hypothetical protein